MLSSLRTRFGIPGVISVIALVFAMFGGAYAASNNGGGKATASAKAKAGPRGKTGKTGPAGPAGPAGAKGDTGAAGANGKDGSNGTNGAPGTSVVSEEFTGEKESHCGLGNGGSKFTAGATKTFACNGKNGKNGEDGEPWTDGGTLPEGSTETGAWSTPQVVTGTAGSPGKAEMTIAFSFPIPLASELDHEHTEFLKKGATGTNCTGTAENPTAPNGFLCVYTGSEPGGGEEGTFKLQSFGLIIKAGWSSTDPFGASRSGSMVTSVISGVEKAPGQGSYAAGTWAVTG